MTPDRTSTRSPFGPPGPEKLPPLVREISARVRERQLSARAKLLVVTLLLATVPLFVASIILPRKVESTLSTLGQAHLAQVADDLAAFTEHQFRLRLENAQLLAEVETFREAVSRFNAGQLDQPLRTKATAQLNSIFRQLKPEFENAFVAGADGTVFAGVIRQEKSTSADFNVADRDYFAAVARTLRPVVSDPLLSKVGGLPVVVIAAPIRDAQGAFAGVIGLALEIEPLSGLIAQRKIGATGYPYAIDRRGILVAHPDPGRFFTDVLIRLANAERLVSRMRRGERGIEAYVSSKGEQKLAAFAPVPICGWSVAASIETSEFVAPAQRIRLIIFGMIGACVVIALVVAATFATGLERLKLALAEARASEARFRLFASVATGAIWDWDLASDELWWNDGLAATFGCSPSQMANYTALRDRIPAAERDQVSIGLRRCLAEGNWSGEHHLRRDDGTLAYVLHRAVAVRGADGKTLRVIGSMTDISERRAIEQKIQEQAALLDQTRDGILVKDLDQVIHFWNSGAEHLYGWTAEEAMGRRSDELLHIDHEAFAQASRLVLQNGHWSGRLKSINKAGANMILDCRWTLVRDEQDRPKSILSISTDVTERLQMEAKFLRTQRLESIGTLAGGIAHDLNNLLAPVLLGVGLLQRPDRDPDEARVIDLIEQSANRGTHLVKQILSFARGVEGARVSVHVGYVIREVETMMRSTFPKNITIRVKLAKELQLVWADPTQLNQVLLNLCVNARDAMPAGGQLSIEARNVELDASFVQLATDVTAGPHVMIELADTGTGMTPEVLEKIYEPFFTTKSAGKGTGLGLSTAIGIVRSHRGTINVYSEIGRGTVFKIYLPVTTADLAQAGPGALAPPPASGNGELLLIVDDEPAILNVTKQTLENHGYRVLLATDGAHAFALYHRHRSEIALVLTDMMMPLMDGLALAAALRRIDPATIIVAASGLHDHNNQIKAADAGLNHFLCKPFTSHELLTTVAAALAKRDRRPLPPQPHLD